MTTRSNTPASPQRIALIGPAGSGKTTHARLLQAAWKGDVLSFASPLKKVCRELFGEAMDDEQFARRAYQVLGTDGVRKLDTNAWVRLLLAKVSPDRNVYVDDARFYNEYVALAHLGFRFVRLAASDAVLHERRPTMTQEERYHQSEVENLWIPTERTFRTDDHSPEHVNQSIRAYLTTTHHTKGDSDAAAANELAALQAAGE